MRSTCSQSPLLLRSTSGRLHRCQSGARSGRGPGSPVQVRADACFLTNARGLGSIMLSARFAAFQCGFPSCESSSRRPHWGHRTGADVRAQGTESGALHGFLEGSCARARTRTLAAQRLQSDRRRGHLRTRANLTRNETGDRSSSSALLSSVHGTTSECGGTYDEDAAGRGARRRSHA
jgi:hypothetical protein